ncbi:MAG: hypothetical protein AAF196_12120 [Planctomycetota bacterium]
MWNRGELGIAVGRRALAIVAAFMISLLTACDDGREAPPRAGESGEEVSAPVAGRKADEAQRGGREQSARVEGTSRGASPDSTEGSVALVGRVVDEQGEPVESVVVRVVQPLARLSGMRSIFNLFPFADEPFDHAPQRTAEDGSFAFREVEVEDSLLVIASAPGLFAAKSVGVSEGRFSRPSDIGDLILQPDRPLFVRVEDAEGAVVESASVSLLPGSPESPTVGALSPQGGVGLPATLDFSGSASGYRMSRAVRAARVVSPFWARETTGSDGVAMFGHTPQSGMDLLVEKAGFVGRLFRATDFDWSADGANAADPLVVRLGVGQTVEIEVVTGAGIPVADAEVALSAAPRASVIGDEAASEEESDSGLRIGVGQSLVGRTGTDGRLLVRGVFVNRLRVEVRSEAHLPSREAVETAERVRVELPVGLAARLVVVPTEGSTEPPSVTDWELHTGSKNPHMVQGVISKSRVSLRGRSTAVGETSLRVVELLPGMPYLAVAHLESGEVARARFEIPADSEEELEVELVPGAEPALRVRVLGPNGDGLEGAAVFAGERGMSEYLTRTFSATTDSTGLAVLEGLDDARGGLLVRHPSFGVAQVKPSSDPSERVVHYLGSAHLHGRLAREGIEAMVAWFEADDREPSPAVSLRNPVSAEFDAEGYYEVSLPVFAPGPSPYRASHLSRRSDRNSPREDGFGLAFEESFDVERWSASAVSRRMARSKLRSLFSWDRAAPNRDALQAAAPSSAVRGRIDLFAGETVERDLMTNWGVEGARVLHGLVQDVDGPVLDATIELFAKRTDSQGYQSPLMSRTGDQGRFRFDELRPARATMSLSVYRRGGLHLEARRAVDLRSGDAFLPIDLPGGTLVIRSAPGTRLVLEPLGGQEYTISGRCDPEGVATIPWIGTEPWRLYLGTQFDARGPASRRLPEVVRLSAGQAILELDRPLDRILGNLPVVVASGFEVPTDRSALQRFALEVHTASETDDGSLPVALISPNEGRFPLVGLGAGTYRLVLRAAAEGASPREADHDLPQDWRRFESAERIQIDDEESSAEAEPRVLEVRFLPR